MAKLDRDGGEERPTCEYSTGRTGFNDPLKIALFAALGGVLTPLAVGLAVASAGAGHGHYVFARLFFPYTMLSTLATKNVVSTPAIVFALLQFPTYGAVLATCSWSRRLWLCAMTILVLHAVGAAACFSGILPNYS